MDEKIEPTYPCDICGKLRTKAEGGTTFSLCDDCWEKHYKKRKDIPENDELLLSKDIEALIEKEADYYAKEIVVPISGNPTTPYEINAVKKYRAEFRLFANRLIAQLSHCKPIIEARVRRETLREMSELGLIKNHNHAKNKGTLGVSCPKCTFELIATIKSGKPIESEEK